MHVGDGSANGLGTDDQGMATATCRPVDTVEPPHRFEEHERARSRHHVDAGLGAGAHRLVGGRAGSAQPLEQPDLVDAAVDALADHADGMVRAHDDDDAVERSGHRGHVVVNDVAECSAEDGADLRDTCLGGLATQSRTDIDFGL